jgi:transposase
LVLASGSTALTATQKPEKKISKVIAKLELIPRKKEDSEILKMIEREGKKVAQLSYWYLRSVLPVYNIKKVKIKDINRNGIWNRILDSAGSTLNKETAYMIFKTCFNNFKVAGEQHGSIPRHFMNDNTTIPIRISKNVNGRQYSRAGTLKLFCGNLYFETRLIKKKKAVFLIPFDKKAFSLVSDILNNRSELALGDPSNIVIRNGRAFLHLSGTKVPDVQAHQMHRVMGIDLGISGPFVAYFIVDFDDKGNLIKRVTAGRIAEKEVKKRWLKHLVKCANRQRIVKSRKKIRISKLTKLNDSQYTEMSRQLVYSTVNRLLDIAKQYSVDIIVAENLRSLKNRIRESKRTTENLFSILKRTKDRKKRKGLQKKMIYEKAYRRLVQSFPYGMFLEDLEQEAIWRGIGFKQVDAYNTSRTCPRCGHISKKNRTKRSLFVCVNCKYSSQADVNGALNLAIRATCPDLQKKAGKRAPSRKRGGLPSGEVIAHTGKGEQSQPPASDARHSPLPVPVEKWNGGAGQIGELVPAQDGKPVGLASSLARRTAITEYSAAQNDDIKELEISGFKQTEQQISSESNEEK